MSEDREPTRLPPPAFPPGSRRHAVSSNAGGQDGSAGGSASQDVGDFTFISPDEPFPDRSAAAETETGTATGIGDDPHLAPEDLVSGGDPHVRELVLALSKLAEAVRRRGETGLRVTAEMSGFESTLRGYCVGYLVGRRADGGVQD